MGMLIVLAYVLASILTAVITGVCLYRDNRHGYSAWDDFMPALCIGIVWPFALGVSLGILSAMLLRKTCIRLSDIIDSVQAKRARAQQLKQKHDSVEESR